MNFFWPRFVLRVGPKSDPPSLPKLTKQLKSDAKLVPIFGSKFGPQNGAGFGSFVDFKQRPENGPKFGTNFGPIIGTTSVTKNDLHFGKKIHAVGKPSWQFPFL